MEFDSILYPHDLFYFGRTVMFYSMVEMIEEGDDVNLINFKSIIDELQLNHNGISPQIQLGKISGAITLQEMICEHKMDLNSVDWSTMIQLTLVKIDDEEIRQGAEEITNMTMIFDKSHNPDDNLEYSVSDLDSDKRKCEKLLANYLREKYPNQKLLQKDFPKEVKKAEQKRLDEDPEYLHEFDDAIEFMDIGDKIYILTSKKSDWKFPKHMISNFHQIKDIRNPLSHTTNDNLEKFVPDENKILGKIFSGKIIRYFEKLNSR